MCSWARARVHFPYSGDDARPVVPTAADLESSTAKCAYQAAVSIAKDLPLVVVVRRRHNVAQDFKRPLHRSDPCRTIFYRRRWNDFGHWLTKPRDPNRLFRGPNLFQQSETLGFEFRDGDFLHNVSWWSL